MKKRKGRKGLLVLIVLLCAALAITVGMIAYKQYEYGVSDSYYESLRHAGG